MSNTPSALQRDRVLERLAPVVERMIRDRDVLWCLSLLGGADVDTVARVLGIFQRERPDKSTPISNIDELRAALAAGAERE